MIVHTIGPLADSSSRFQVPRWLNEPIYRIVSPFQFARADPDRSCGSDWDRRACCQKRRDLGLRQQPTEFPAPPIRKLPQHL